jgi:hypothetical protein
MDQKTASVRIAGRWKFRRLKSEFLERNTNFKREGRMNNGEEG